MMFFHSHPEKETQHSCIHCWSPISEDCLVKFLGRNFCSFNCIKGYYGCIFRLFLVYQGKRFKAYIFRKKNWLTGLLAGSILSLLLTIILGFILTNPFSGPPKLPPITEATVDIPMHMIYPFALKAPLSMNQVEPASQTGITVLDNTRERQIKERVKIFLIREYPSGPQKTVSISGQASTGSVCGLYLNDMLYEATTCNKGHFFFPRIALKSRKNIIEVLVHDPEGFIIPSNKIELLVDRNRQITEKGRNITRGSLESSRVCLTFDGGASASCALEILETLKKYNILCTFFLTGDFIRNHPTLVKMMLKDGHEIGNHTDTHPHFARLTDQMRFETLPWVNKAFVQNQLIRAEKLFFQVTGECMAPFWRAPYGEHNLEILRWAEEIGYTHISWTCGRDLEEGLDSLDWVYNQKSPIYYSADEIRDKIIHFGAGNSEGANGGIVLMHLATSRPIEDRIHRQLPAIIKGLRNRGYTLSTIGEIMEDFDGFIDSDRGDHMDSAQNLWKSKRKKMKPKKEISKRRKIPSKS